MTVRATGHKDVPLAQLSDSALMDTLNFPDGIHGEGQHAAIIDFSYTRMAIRDYHELTRMIREYGPDVTLGTLKNELLSLVRHTVTGK